MNLFKDKFSALGGILLFVYFIIAIAGPFIFYKSAYEVDLANCLKGPSREHLFGTDGLGRDLLARIIVGARYSFAISFGSMLVVIILGLCVGTVAAYYNGSIADHLLMSIIDAVAGIPVVIMSIIIVSVVPSRVVGLGIALLAVYFPTMVRLARAKALEVRAAGYVEAALAVGSSIPRILFRHIIPNTFQPVLADGLLRTGEAIILVAALSYVGLGVTPPTPEWGVLLRHGTEYLFIAPHTMIMPGVMLSILVLAINLLGEGLRNPIIKRR